MADRRLTRDGAAVALNARYFDALALLVREHGQLVSKDRFLDEVWRGVPVTDEALTQCVRTLRKALGDEVGSPRFIQTVPKHGYRFIAPVENAPLQSAPLQSAPVESAPPGPVSSVADAPPADLWRETFRLGAAGTLGAGLAGAIGGLCYGLLSAAQPGAGAVSTLLVLLCLTVAIALLGGAGVAFGIAAAELTPGRPWWRGIFGGAVGGLTVGTAVKLVGLDAFALLFGRAPVDITGGGEGAMLGGAVGLAAFLAGRVPGPLWRRLAAAGATGGAAGLAITLLGGRLMGGSLDLLASSFPDSRLRLGRIGDLLGEPGFGSLAQALTGAAEGALFAGCIVGAMRMAGRAAAGPVTRP